MPEMQFVHGCLPYFCLFYKALAKSVGFDGQSVEYCAGAAFLVDVAGNQHLPNGAA